MFSRDTSLITILSSSHGRLRREQRDIDKRDLQRALKHGKVERCWGGRYKVEYDGITFITDASMRREVTAFPSPLPDMKIDFATTQEHRKAKLLFDAKPELATSHTVFVVDNSGSMLSKSNNIHHYRDSQNAAFSMTALEFVAEQLFNNTAVNSDLVSLIKFDSSASVEICREPMSWKVYNQFLSHRNCQKFVSRQLAPSHDEVYGRSSFSTALSKAKDLLERGYHDQCAQSLFFFSDGKATDHITKGTTRAESQQEICKQITSLSKRFGDAFTVTVMGLGGPYDDFTLLKGMAEAASAAGSKGSFELCNGSANAIGSAISSLVSSTTESRISLQTGSGGRFTQRGDLLKETDAALKFDWQYFYIADHFVYDPVRRDCYPATALPLAAAESNLQQAAAREMSPPDYLAVNRNFVGKGAERVAYRSRLADKQGRADSFVFGTMIAKETKFVERIEEERFFHTGFSETQHLANFLADEFNSYVRALPNYDANTTPELKFLSCSILLLKDEDWPRGLRGVLVEKMLDTERFRWTKWNDNNGMVIGGTPQHAPIDVDFELKQLKKEQTHDAANRASSQGGLGAITEEDEEEESDEDSVSDVESVGEQQRRNEGGRRTLDHQPADYLQAFTHFTHRYTNKKAMVVDLQGVYNTDMTPPTFELTDPAIHYASAKGRRMVYGRTDKGKSGMHNFFKSHKCNAVCKALLLNASNKQWQRNWRDRYESQSHSFGSNSFGSKSTPSTSGIFDHGTKKAQEKNSCRPM